MRAADSLALRVKMLREEADTAFARMRRHEAKHGCEPWVNDWRSGKLIWHFERECAVLAALRESWWRLKEAAILPSRDQHIYRDADPEWTAPLTTEADHV